MFDDRLISTHTPHARRDCQLLYVLLSIPIFQLTRLMRGVTARSTVRQRHSVFQLTRLMRGVTYNLKIIVKIFVISTHTPHARRD